MAPFNTTQWGGTPIAGAVCFTPRQMIYRAFRDLKVSRSGQGPNTEMLQDGLDAMQELIDSWNIERLMVRAVTRELVDVDGNPYLVVQPQKLEALGYVDVNGSESQVELIGWKQWAEIAGKDTEPDTPSVAYLDNAWPEQQMHPNPVPEEGEWALYMWQVIELISDLDTVYCFPSGYAAAIRWNLADYLAPSFAGLYYKGGDILHEQIAQKARYFKGKVKSYNAKPPLMSCDPALLGSVGRSLVSGTSGSGSAGLGDSGSAAGRTWDEQTQTWVNTTTTWATA